MNLLPRFACVAIVLLGSAPTACERPPDWVFCNKNSLRSMLNDVIYANSPDEYTKAFRPDAQAIKDNLDNHAAGGGPSSPGNLASFEKFRWFVKRKCDGKDIGQSLTELAPGMRIQ
jgi:hypothetical protein